jgi:hypothetical protein
MGHGQNGAHSSEFPLRNKLEGHTQAKGIKFTEAYKGWGFRFPLHLAARLNPADKNRPFRIYQCKNRIYLIGFNHPLSSEYPVGWLFRMK